MKYKIIPATNGPKHHLFGFHDLVAFNQTGEKLLSLEADVINRPPLPGEQFGVVYGTKIIHIVIKGKIWFVFSCSYYDETIFFCI